MVSRSCHQQKCIITLLFAEKAQRVFSHHSILQRYCRKALLYFCVLNVCRSDFHSCCSSPNTQTDVQEESLHAVVFQRVGDSDSDSPGDMGYSQRLTKNKKRSFNIHNGLTTLPPLNMLPVENLRICTSQQDMIKYKCKQFQLREGESTVFVESTVSVDSFYFNSFFHPQGEKEKKKTPLVGIAFCCLFLVHCARHACMPWTKSQFSAHVLV